MLSESNTQEQEEEYDDIAELTWAWTSERSAPELLGFRGAQVSRVLELLRAQEDFVADLEPCAAADASATNSATDTDAAATDAAATDGTDADFVRSVFCLEMERVKFVLRSYLRTRLHKIEAKSLAILSNPEYTAMLSPEELAYAKRFNDIALQNYKMSFMNDSLPASLQAMDDPAIVGAPDLNQAVFFRTRADIGEHLLPNGETLDLSKNKIYLLRYNTIRSLVKEGAIDLI